MNVRRLGHSMHMGGRSVPWRCLLVFRVDGLVDVPEGLVGVVLEFLDVGLRRGAVTSLQSPLVPDDFVADT